MNENQPSDESNLLDKAVRQLQSMPESEGPPADVLDNVLAIPQMEAAKTSTGAEISTRGDRQTSPASRRTVWIAAAVCLLAAIGVGWWIVRDSLDNGRVVAIDTSDKDRSNKGGRDDGKKRAYAEGDGYDDDRGDAKNRGNAVAADQPSATTNSSTKPRDKDPASKYGNSGKDKYGYGDVGYESGRDAERTLIVSLGDSALGNTPDGDAGAPLPFGRERWADDIALGVVGEPFERDGKKFIPLDLIEVYKGQLPSGRFVTDDREVVRVECSLETRLGLRSDLFKPKSRVGVYFLRDPKKGWTVHWIQNLGAGGEAWRRSTKLFCDLQFAPEAKNPVARYEELLPADKPLDHAAGWALQYIPSPHALPALRKHWQRVVMREPERTSGIAALLGMLNDAKSIEPVLDYALTQKVGARWPFFNVMDGLCNNADEEMIRKVQRELMGVLASLPNEKEVKASNDAQLVNDFHGANSARAALEGLLNKRSKRKDDALKAFRSQIGPIVEAKLGEKKAHAILSDKKNWSVQLQPFCDAMSRVEDTLTADEQKRQILQGKIADLDRPDNCWAVQYSRPKTSIAGYLDPRNGKLILLWNMPEG